MLGAAGIKAYPALTSSSFRVNEELPNPFQFNHAIVAIPGDALDGSFSEERAFVKGWLFIDVTDPTIYPGELPVSLQGSHALPVTGGPTELIELPYGEAGHYNTQYSADATLSTDGSFTAFITIYYLGNNATTARYQNQYLTRIEQIEKWRDTFSSTVANVKVSNFFAGDQGDTAWIRFQIRGNEYLLKNKGKWLLKVDFFRPPSHPRLTTAQRHHSIWFGPPQKRNNKITWHLPSGWSCDPRTTTITRSHETGRIGCEISMQDSTLHYHCEEERNGYPMKKEEYTEAHAIEETVCQCDGLTLYINPNVFPSENIKSY